MHMKTASVLSTALHIAVLGWATLSFSTKAYEVTPVESLPVDIISEKDFSEVTKGVKDAPKVEEKPKPVVEKVAEPKPKPVEELKPVVDEKREVEANKEAAPKPPTPEPTPDAIADKLKEQPKQEAAKTEPQPLPPKKPPVPKQPEQKFDPTKIAALLDKRDPTRAAATGSELNRTPGLGVANGMAAQLSQSEMDAFMRRVQSCWNVPVGAEDASELKVVFRVQFRRDGAVSGGPDIVMGTGTPLGKAYADSGRRAVLQCQPYTMLRPEKYDTWKDLEVEFRPSRMF